MKTKRTHCLKGHELTPENSYQHPDGYSKCRTCMAIAKTQRTAPKPPRETCKHGHAMVGDNVYYKPGAGWRCRTCQRAYQKIANERYLNSDTDVAINPAASWPEGCFKGQDVDEMTLLREAQRQRVMPSRGFNYTIGGVARYG